MGHWGVVRRLCCNPVPRRSWERLRLLAIVHRSTNEVSLFGRVLANNSFLLPFGVMGDECHRTYQCDRENQEPVHKTEARPVPRPSGQFPLGKLTNPAEAEYHRHESPDKYEEIDTSDFHSGPPIRCTSHSERSHPASSTSRTHLGTSSGA